MRSETMTDEPRVPEYLWVIHNGAAMEFLTDTLRLVRVKEGWALAGPDGDIMLSDCYPDEQSALSALAAVKGEGE